jgi:HKD family nuclease
MKLYSNYKDTHLQNRLEQVCKNSTVYISVAFFSNFEFIKKCLDNNCEILLIVRLDFGTNPDALIKIHNLNNPYINMRYYACNEFHPKYYIIDNVCAFIGSSNLTYSGIYKNLEMNIEINCESEMQIYEELKIEFWREWNEANPLTKEKIDKFKEKHDQFGNKMPDSNRTFFSENDLVLTPNIINDNKKIKKNEEITKFEKDYQLYISAFNRLKLIYSEVSDERKYDNELPLRIELDRFLSWIKDKKYTGEEYLNVQKKDDEEIRGNVKFLKNEFLNYTTSNYYNTTTQRYYEIIKKLGKKENISVQNKEQLFEALTLINAIHDQLRFHPGGMPTLKNEFLEMNDEIKIKNTLIHLLEGTGNFIRRIYDITHPSIYKLEILGDSSIKELYGYINNEDIPTCNQRMLHSMQWLGFGKL